MAVGWAESFKQLIHLVEIGINDDALAFRAEVQEYSLLMKEFVDANGVSSLGCNIYMYFNPAVACAYGADRLLLVAGCYRAGRRP